MKKSRIQKYHGLALAALLLGSAGLALAQTQDTVVNSFDTGTPGVPPDSTGVTWALSALAYDNTVDVNGNGGGALLINATWSSSSDTPCQDYICFPPYDNWYWNGNTNVPLSQYVSVEFDIMWDTADSDPDFTLGVWNDPTTVPASWLPNWATGSLLAGSIPGIEIEVTTGGGIGPTIGSTNFLPSSATSWEHVSIPINPSQPNIDGACGIVLKKWINNNWGIVGNHNAYFWVDNVWIKGSAAPPPPPTVQNLVKPIPGLNVMSCSPGINDRQQVVSISTNGLSWVGHASVANPVTYSFTINGFPQDPASQYSCEAYLMFSPNPAYMDNALDWNETNCVKVSLEQGAGTTLMNFFFKTNLPSGPTGTVLGSVTNSGTALGTWTVTFTSDTNVTLTAPDNSQSSFIFPPEAVGQFAENPSAGRPGCYLYLGMQPNNSASQNKPVSYSHFAVTGAPSALSDNFLADPVLNTNMWANSPATGPQGVFVMTNSAAYWISWTTPASGYKLQNTSDLLGSWTMQTNNVILNGPGAMLQLLTTNELPVATSTSFFRLIKP